MRRRSRRAETLAAERLIQRGNSSSTGSKGPLRWEGEDARGGESDPKVQLTLDGIDAPLQMEGRTLLLCTRPACDAVLAAHGVSSVHAVVFRRGASHFVRDLNSEGGTYVNGRLVRE